MKRLTNKDFEWAARTLGCEIAAIKAIAAVESAGAGFLQDGQPKILFEAHWFSKLTNRKYDRTHPHISSPVWNRRLYVGGIGEHRRLQEAVALNKKAALSSASWGKFQILGANWGVCKYPSLQAFINDMYDSEGGHLRAFVRFVQSKNLTTAIRNKNWARFALVYNGPGYRLNRYDIKMAQAYARYSDAIA